MSDRPAMTERIRYRVDNFLAKGSGPLFIALVVAFLASLFSVAFLRVVFQFVEPTRPDTALQHAWTVFLELTDPGNMNADTPSSAIYKFTGILAGLSGVVIFSALIAFLTTALEQAIDSLKRGDSRVLESEHTLILGWGGRVTEILRELVEANESEDNPVVVILGDAPKEEMDTYLRENFTDRRNTRVVTRSGSTSSIASLAKVNAAQAKSAIVLAIFGEGSSVDEKAQSDARVIKTALALMAFVESGADINIVAEVYDNRNREVVRDVDPDHISVINAQEILAKIMVQTSRTSGLAVVYSELLSFEGCELYFYEADWRGMNFAQVQFFFPDGVPIGIRGLDGEVTVRPALDRVMQPKEEVLIIAEDDSTIELLREPVMMPGELPFKSARIAPRAERQLIIGWSEKAPIIISEYADYVLMGSTIDVMLARATDDVKKQVLQLDSELETLSIGIIEGDPLSIDALREVRPFGYNNVIVLPQMIRGDMDPERMDAETLIVLLHLRKLQAAHTQQTERSLATKIITEVLDSENQELITRAGVNDFIISNRMVSMFLAQISEEAGIQAVYDDLFEEDGSEIYLKPAWLYFPELPITCRFGDLMRHAQKRDAEICIGYKLKAFENDSDRNFGVKLIPPKDATITLSEEDALVVVAEDDR